MKQVFVVDNVVVACAGAFRSGTTFSVPHEGAFMHELPVDSPVSVGWVRNDVDGMLDFIPPPPSPPTVGPNQFYFLWTMMEQVSIEEIRQVDPVVKLFMRRLDDPRTNEVSLADPAVQAAVRHMVAQLVLKGVIKESDADERTAAILAGRAY